MKTYLIGIDIGTSGCKIAVFNKSRRSPGRAERNVSGVLSKARMGRAKSGGLVEYNLPGTSGNVTKKLRFHRMRLRESELTGRAGQPSQWMKTETF